MRLFSGKCTSSARLDGKTAIVTGSNTGIGKETVKDFFLRGARVLMLCRNTEKAQEAAEDIKKQCTGKTGLGEIVVEELDLSSLKSIKTCAEKVKNNEDRINILVNNAGVMMCPLTRTEDGFEMQFGTNHLGHFYLTLLLLPKIIKSAPARIVNVSSLAHNRGQMNFDDLNWEKRNYSAVGAYGQSKLANILFTKELARRLQERHISGVSVYSLHPGVIKTELGRHMNETYFLGVRQFLRLFSIFMKSPEQGAQTSIYCSVDERIKGQTGLYYKDCDVAEPAPHAKDESKAKTLWEMSLKLVGLENYNPFQST
ncbi:retinol dehydrogenase 13 isoform X2 [Agrilus planipennis]|uniref:Retinol dehydrogenase 13 isoform X2 n=1 Tax=Agrilus planipennis TaxID=224129 RepID=A0A7F5RM44_AGRPL|nr:retinol dehydrogenase 13 isoform X2 [Agrilus planipennis]